MHCISLQCKLYLSFVPHCFIYHFSFFWLVSVYIYVWVHCLPSYLIHGGSPPTLSTAVNIASPCHPSYWIYLCLLLNQILRHAMDCACDCLARMEPMLETCIFSEGLVLNQRQRHSALCSLLYSPFIGFRAPFVHQMTDDDVNDSWVCIFCISFSFCCV